MDYHEPTSIDNIKTKMYLYTSNNTPSNLNDNKKMGEALLHGLFSVNSVGNHKDGQNALGGLVSTLIFPIRPSKSKHKVVCYIKIRCCCTCSSCIRFLNNCTSHYQIFTFWCANGKWVPMYLKGFLRALSLDKYSSQMLLIHCGTFFSSYWQSFISFSIALRYLFTNLKKHTLMARVLISSGLTFSSVAVLSSSIFFEVDWGG